LEEAAGCISQEYVYLYPPGIPLVVPGEVLDESLLGQILTLKQQGAELNGLADLTNRRINIVIF
jgi:arginine/lysine/ornithine decarboxylase